MLATGEYKGPDYYNYDGSINPDSSYAKKARNNQFGSGGRNSEPDINLGDFVRGAFPNDEAYREAYGLPNNRGNKIDTSNNSNEKMSEIGLPGFPFPGGRRGGRRNFGGGFRERDMVDLELDRGGRTSAFIPVGQHRDSPHLGYTNDFASDPRGRGGAKFLDFYSGGGLSNQPANQSAPQVVSTPHNIFNPTVTFNPTFNHTFNPSNTNQNSNTFNPTFTPTNTSNPTFNPTNTATGPTTQLAGGDIASSPQTNTPTTTVEQATAPTTTATANTDNTTTNEFLD